MLVCFNPLSAKFLTALKQENATLTMNVNLNQPVIITLMNSQQIQVNLHKYVTFVLTYSTVMEY